MTNLTTLAQFSHAGNCKLCNMFIQFVICQQQHIYFMFLFINNFRRFAEKVNKFQPRLSLYLQWA